MMTPCSCTAIQRLLEFWNLLTWRVLSTHSGPYQAQNLNSRKMNNNSQNSIGVVFGEGRPQCQSNTLSSNLRYKKFAKNLQKEIRLCSSIAVA